MYLQAAMEYSKDISEKKLNLTSALTIAFASVCMENRKELIGLIFVFFRCSLICLTSKRLCL
jgi:hypothetical protein